jgi:putative drug exporter of the RND superfamily
MSARHSARPLIARAIRLLPIPIILGWLAIAAVTNAVVPQLEMVGKQHSVSLSPQDAPALIAMKKLGSNFQQFDSDSMAMIVFEGDQPLGDEAHRYYNDLVRRLEQDIKHVQHVQNFWGDLITAAGSQSTDGKAAYVQVNLAGNQGQRHR